MKQSLGKFNFENTENVHEASGYTHHEKEILFELLLHFGVPTVSQDDIRDDWELLRILLVKHSKGLDSEVNIGPENLKILEKFVQSLNTMSTKIMKEYQKPVGEILKRWKEEDKSDDSSSDTEMKNEDSKKDKKEEEEVNDFKIDILRIQAAHEYEKTNKRLVYDPDNDGFNFGYERALYFKVRMITFKIIRKEIIS